MTIESYDSMSTLDLIFVSGGLDVADCGVDDTVNISDHLMTYVTFRTVHLPRQARFVLSRDLGNIHLDDIDSLLSEIDWSPLFRALHVDEMVSYFSSFLLSVFDHLAPLRYRHASRPPS